MNSRALAIAFALAVLPSVLGAQTLTARQVVERIRKNLGVPRRNRLAGRGDDNSWPEA